ncbi:hypothetical protein [Desulfosarcina ovata]|uniref:hypothetical protein n=1 Tax=Desulfosarcina ovata TaxID=83564 RepID=UPI0012D32BBF|nr:hypothetical protein [Desulfosarcina ovata]
MKASIDNPSVSINASGAARTDSVGGSFSRYGRSFQKQSGRTDQCRREPVLLKTDMEEEG